MELYTWLGIIFCISQSAMFSGLNLALFSVSRLRLEVEASGGNIDASKVLNMRKDSNFALTTVLWGNVGINVLLTLLSDSVLAGVGAFVFSTVVITLIGEIAPQAYFSRHALRVASLLSPIFRFYQILLYPVAKPIAKVLDLWLGKEGIKFFRERDLEEIIKKHIYADEAEVGYLEGVGALNFLTIDDLLVTKEGEVIDPDSIIKLPVENNIPIFPKFERESNDAFLQKIHSSRKNWIIICEPNDEPLLVLDSDAFLREALFSEGTINPFIFCHKPIIIKDQDIPLKKVIPKFTVHAHLPEDDIIDYDIILVWGENEKRIITGTDILGRLLRGITKRKT